MKLVCPKCSKSFEPEKGRYLCDCGSILMVEYDKLTWAPEGDGVWRYSFALPVDKEIKRVTLDEGNTPLIKSTRTEFDELYFKYEGENPTDSFKDRGTTVVITKALQEGFSSTAVASTGNMGASISAYSAHAGLNAKVFVPTKTETGKLAQIIAYGANLVKVDGFFDDCVKEMWTEVNDHGAYLAMTGLNPYYLEGEKTLGFELFEEIGVPDRIIMPMGTGGFITAVWKAFLELKKMRVSKALPQMIGVQAEGCAPIVDAWKNGTEEVQHIQCSDSIAGAIMVKVPFNGSTAVRALNDSGGLALTVTDDEIHAAIKELGSEGVFAEPASATTLAGLRKLEVQEDEKIALVITGHGLKDPKAVLGK